MGLKTQSAASEVQAVATICDGDEKLRARLFAALRPHHFVTDVGRPAFERVLGLVAHQKSVPSVSILAQDPTLQQDVQESLRSFEDVCENEDETNALIDQLELFRKLRLIYDGTSDMLGDMKEPDSETVNNALDKMERIVVQARADHESVDMVHSGLDSNAKQVVANVLSQKKPDRVLTGFKKFDEASGGWARKDLVLIAANTGGGKSVMANQLAQNIYWRGKSVALISFEMDEEEIYARLLASLPGVQVGFDTIYLRRFGAKYTTGKDLRAIKKVEAAWENFNRHGELEKIRFTIWCPTVDVTPNQIGAILKPHNYDAILIDYVGLVAAEKDAALWENLGSITRDFKGVARRNNCVVAVMAQLDEDTNKVKYSKAMRHHSSYVWWWHYDEEAAESGRVKVHQDKTRHCKKFNFDLLVDFENMRFLDEVPDEDVGKGEVKMPPKRKEDDTEGALSPEETKSLVEEARERVKFADDAKVLVKKREEKDESRGEYYQQVDDSSKVLTNLGSAMLTRKMEAVEAPDVDEEDW